MVPATVVECYSCVPACVSLSLFATLQCSKHDAGQRAGAQVRQFQWRFQSLSRKSPPACEQHPHISAGNGAAKGSRLDAAEIGTEIGIAIGAVVGAVIGTAVGTVIGAVVRRVPTPLAYVHAEGSLGKTVEGRVTPEDDIYDGMVSPDDTDLNAIQPATGVCGVVRPAPLMQATAPASCPCETRGSVSAAAYPNVAMSQCYADVGSAFHCSEHLLRDTSNENLDDWELVDPSPVSSTSNVSKQSEYWSSSIDINDQQSSELLKHCVLAPNGTPGNAQQRVAPVPTSKPPAIPIISSLTSAKPIRDANANETITVANYISPRAKLPENFLALQKYIQCISSENTQCTITCSKE